MDLVFTGFALRESGSVCIAAVAVRVFFRQNAGFFLDLLDFLPSGFADDLSFYRKSFAFADSGYFCLLILAGRHENGKETGNDQFVDFAFSVFQIPRADALFGRDNGMVVGDFFVVDKGGVSFDRGFEQLAADGTVAAKTAGADAFRQCGYKVFRQISGIGSWISDYFVVFIQMLHIVQRLLGGKSEHAVGVLLQRSQVVQLGRIGFLLFLLDFFYGCRAVGDLCLYAADGL